MSLSHRICDFGSILICNQIGLKPSCSMAKLYLATVFNPFTCRFLQILIPTPQEVN